jgi:glycosyltransferase involved in cell wall biosynthesis
MLSDRNYLNQALPPFVSIIVPTFNPGPFFEKTLISISSQEYKNFEIIVVDDCSTDDHFSYILNLNKRYKFKIIRLKKNSGGCAKPLNTGIQFAGGKYISICAQDDYFLPQKTKIQVEFLEKNKQHSMVFSDSYTVFGDLDNDLFVQRTPKRRSGQIFDDIILQRFYIPALTVTIRREVFSAVGNFDEELLIEDWDMWLRIADAFSIGYINDRLACYRIHNSNISKLRSKKMIEDRIKILSKWKQASIYGAAVNVANFLDANSRTNMPPFFIRVAGLALIALRQPIRWFSVLISVFEVGRELKLIIKRNFRATS